MIHFELELIVEKLDVEGYEAIFSDVSKMTLISGFADGERESGMISTRGQIKCYLRLKLEVPCMFKGTC